uniref:WDFY family member 4 n=1 Tax=Podarcis muralis TaxID=64176 RepID=A0A670I2V6_PODMU
MLNIYAEDQGVEELLMATDLQSLIIAAASFWDRGSPSWKGPTSRVLRTISKAQSRNTISYLQAMDCIKISVQNLSRLADSLSPCDVCEAVNIILCFVRDSYLISPALLLEFENNGGYQLLLKVFLRYEGLLSSKEDASVKEMLDFLAQLTVCGKTELKVSGNITPPQLPQFSAKQPPSPGNTVKNLKAFQVLESLFRKSSNAELCQHILLALKDIWTWNPMNFFLLEWSLQPISQFVGIIPLKPMLVQRQFFQLVESLVLDLSYIPHEILKDVQGLIKESPDPLCTSLALRCLHNITQRDLLFTDIFRDSGLLGMLLAQLRKEAKILRKKGGNQAAYQDQAMERELTNRTLKLVAALTGGSVRNTVVLRDYGMVPYIKIFIDDELYRNDTLTILEHLSVINPEEYMSIIVGALCSSTQGELNFKLDLLKSLLRTLDNPKGRSAFRTSSGFNGLLSLLADMEGALQDPPSSLWAPFGPSHIMELVLHILQAIAAAIYSDAVNRDFFQKNGLFDKMAEDLGLLGCFSGQKWGQIPVQLHATRSFAEFSNAAVSSPESFPTWLKSCIIILSFLDNMAKRNPFELKSYLVDMKLGVDQVPQDDGEIVCPGALCVMVKLICKLYNEAHPELSWEIQYAVANHIQSLMKMEKNRQVACGAGLLNALVTSCLEVLHNDNNALHLPLIRLFEKLASQSIEPNVLRETCPTGMFPPSWSIVQELHYSADLHRASLGSDASWVSNSSAVALQAAMSLVSMTTPRSLDSHHACLAPSFVEFDMSLEGYGCLFLPALSTVLGPNAESSILGGTGKGPRPFPPLDGLTFSSWFLVSKMGSVHSGHPLRFLTLVRHMARTEEEFVCFAVSFSPMDGCLTISTEEVAFQALDMMEPEFGDLGRSSALSQVQFRCAKLLVTRQWHHLAVTVAKETKQTCTISAYVNGQRVGSAKMQYIQPLPGNFVSMDPSSFIDVYGYVATPRIWKQKSSLTWCQGPMYLFEEALSVGTLQLIANLGPRYCSNFQAVGFKGRAGVLTSALVAQEKISFGINAMNSSYTTIKNIKDFYGEVDGRLIAKEVSLSSRDSTTPVFMFRNTAGKLPGPLRTIGSVAVGLYGTRVFQSCPAAVSLNYIGGPAIMLGLLAMAHDDHTVYAAVKVLHTVLCSSAMSENLMRQIGGYQLLAYLLKRKIHLLNSRILQLVFALAGIAEISQDAPTIKNLEAFQHIVCCFELWCHAPENMEISLFEHLTEILQTSSDPFVCYRKGSWDMQLAHRVKMVPRLFILFSDPEITRSRIGRICTVLSHLLRYHFSIKDIDWVGLFLVYTLYPSSVDESHTCPDYEDGQTSGEMIWLRNQLLRMLLDVMPHHILCSRSFCFFHRLWFAHFNLGLSQIWNSVHKPLCNISLLFHQDLVSRLEEYRRNGQELYALLCKDHAERLMCGYNKSAKAWADLEEQLVRRGGPWASALAPSTSRWILDGYEGPSRMRKRVWLKPFIIYCKHSAHVPVFPTDTGEQKLNGREGEMDCGQLTFFPALHESFQSEEFLEMCAERKIILQEFVQDEKITCRQSVVVVQGHIVLEGALLFGQEHFYIFLSSPRSEIALEIFFRSGYSIFLVFHNSDRTKTLKRREISNFDYLMYLNTLAGRTYSDLMQYPVFPWVLADYHSQTLDLTNPSAFRDFAKPMGAQTRERKRKFLQRYEEVEKSEGNLSAQCHYCTHYSSAIIVASYLVRMEPFNQIFCSLQGGGFDVAERMFHSMKSTWDSASRDNMTDVRELIPEFFYLPEFLTNCNQFALGNLQDGTSLGDVLLPPWAEGSPHKFISLHRQALESDYVSNHIHHWIDLIFGYKQRGPAAAKAVNVFHPYFYGDQVHPDSISDPLIKNTVLGFVSNFGQIPKQLFSKPHPARNTLGKHSMSRESILFSQTASQLPPTLNNLRNLKPSSVAVKGTDCLGTLEREAPQGPVGHIICTEKGTLAVGKNKILIPPQWNKVFCWGFDDFTCCLAASGSDKKVTTFEITADWGVCLCAVCPTPTTLITSGSSSALCVWELSVARDGDACLNLKQPLYGHTQPVTCLAASTSYSIIVSGSTDRSCIIWDLNQLTPIAQLPGHEACLSAVAINDSTGDIASCAGTALYLWNVNGQPLATATFSPGATILCCCFMEVIDWDVQSLIVTGDTDGTVKVGLSRGVSTFGGSSACPTLRKSLWVFPLSIF